MKSALAEPLKLGGLTLRNRVVHGAISTKFVRDGIIRHEFVDYHARRAEGGVAMTITEAMSVSRTTADLTRVAITDPANREWLLEMARRVDALGGAIVGQLWHNGNARHNGRSSQAAGISLLPDDLSLTVARVMDGDELDELVEAFVISALALRDAGFAGVELSGAHGFLIHQTLSPRLNDRTDRYGGSLNGRTLFVRSIISAIRARCGPAFVVGVKMPCNDGVSGSIDPAEAAAICRSLNAGAKPDYYCFSTGSHSRSLEMHLPALGEAELAFREYLPALRAVTGDVPILAIGKILSVEDAEELIGGGMAEAVVLGRGLLADPDWPRKAIEGRGKEIIPCIACNLCWTEINRGRTIACAVNPDAPNGPALVRRPDQPASRFDVVGSGVAAMEAAARLAAAGQEVNLITRSGQLGGALALLAPLVTTGELERYLDHLRERLERLGIAAVHEVPDGAAKVVNAAGATMRPPATDGRHPPLSLREALRRRHLTEMVGEHAVLFDDDHTEGTYVAAIDFARRFDRLTIVTPRATIATDMGMINALKIHRCTQELHVRVVPFSVLREAGDGRVGLCNVYTGEASDIEGVDLLVYSTPRCQNDIGCQATRIGDAAAPRDLLAATRDAAEFVRRAVG